MCRSKTYNLKELFHRTDWSNCIFRTEKNRSERIQIKPLQITVIHDVWQYSSRGNTNALYACVFTDPSLKNEQKNTSTSFAQSVMQTPSRSQNRYFLSIYQWTKKQLVHIMFVHTCVHCYYWEVQKTRWFNRTSAHCTLHG